MLTIDHDHGGRDFLIEWYPKGEPHGCGQTVFDAATSSMLFLDGLTNNLKVRS
jgi:hypothetical protein